MADVARGPQSDPVYTARGVVFDDANGNGRRDPGEAGVPGVAVSDQFKVRVTAADGSFDFEEVNGLHFDAQVIFVSVPDGWAPSGPFWHPQTKQVQVRQQHDFGLRRTPAAGEFTFLHASDTHLDTASLPRMQRLRALVEQQRPAFVLISGDLIRDALRVGEAPARAQYEMLRAELAKFPVPVWTVPGNHEIFGIERHQSLVSREHPLFGKKMYRHYLGPDYFSFTYGDVHFVGLDTVDVSDLWYYGHVDPAQLAWLERDLAAVPPGTPVVTFNHIPLASAVEGLRGFTEDEPAPTLIRMGGKMQFRHVVSNPGAVLAVIQKNHRLEIALGGHFHTRETIAYKTSAGLVRIFQTGAVVAPHTTGGMTMVSGVTLYRVRNGKVDDGTFLPLDP
jgi:hypothetical protein